MDQRKKPTALELVCRFLSWVLLFGIPLEIVERLINASVQGVRIEPMWAIFFAILAVVIFHGAVMAWQTPEEE